MSTPKLGQLQEVHTTTILEENETMRGSIERIGQHNGAAVTSLAHNTS